MSYFQYEEVILMGVGDVTVNISKCSEKALHFNGATAFMNCGTNESLSITDNISIEIWLRSGDLLQNNTYILAMGAWDALDRFNITINPAERIEINFGDGVNTAAVAFVNFLDTTDWIHMVLVATPDNFKIYKDGVLFGTMANSLGTLKTNNQFVLGRHYPGLGNYYSGDMDNVKLFNRVLSKSEITDLYNGKNIPKRVGCWSMNNPSDAGHDDSGNGNNGTITDATSIGGHNTTEDDAKTMRVNANSKYGFVPLANGREIMAIHVEEA